MRQINPAAEDLIKGFEELRLTAYDDAAPAKVLRPGAVILGTLTIGWGHTGPDVVIGQTITEAQAETWFAADLADTVRVLEQAVLVPVTDNQVGALASLAFNIGNEAFVGSTLLLRLNAPDFAAVPAEITKWIKTTVGDKKVTSKGLIRRRAAEVNLWSSEGSPDAFTDRERGNQVAQPPDAKPKVTDPIVVGGGIAALAAILSDVAHQLEPLIGYGDAVKWLFLAVSVAAAGVAVYARVQAIGHEAH
jgi:lysozyme